MKTFWLSFCDGDRPEGEQFLGACLIDVTEDEAAEMAIEVMLRFPKAEDGAEWIAAACRKAHVLKCNPGGEVATYDITGRPEAKAYPRGQLMTKREVEDLEPAEKTS